MDTTNFLSDNANNIGVVALAAIATTIALQFLVSGSIQYRTRTEGLHLARRLQHATTGLLFYGISYTILGEKNWHIITIGILFFFALVVYQIHLWRLRNDRVRKFLAEAYASILRERELKGGVPGAFYFLLGTACALTIADVYESITGDVRAMKAVRLGLLYLSLGDPSAAIFGSLLASKKDEKSIIGSLTCFFVCFACSILETRDLNLCVAGALIGTFSERYSVYDDNLSIPVVSTIGILILFYFNVIINNEKLGPMQWINDLHVWLSGFVLWAKQLVSG